MTAPARKESDMRERERLIARIRQIRRLPGTPNEAAKAPAVDSAQDQLRVLEARVEHLEQLVQGLQDSVHRESSRHAKRIAELESRVQPAALGKALSDDARTRGL
jgi:TolA-binding protein